MEKIKLNVLQEEERQAVKNRLQKAWEQKKKDMLDPTADMTESERKQYENRVITKMKMGKHLTEEEMNYLKVHNPIMYQKAQRAEQKKKQLEKQCARCKSKEEVNQAVSNAVSGIGDMDPDREYIAAAIQETAKEVRQSAQYARLPETAEEGKKQNNCCDIGNGEQEKDREYSPLIEVMESMPVFDAVQ